MGTRWRVGLIGWETGTGAAEGEADLGLRPEVFLVVALRPRRRDGLSGTGTEWEGGDRVKARPRKPPEKDRRDRGPPPEQWKC